VRTRGRERKAGGGDLFAQMSAEEEVEEGGRVGEVRLLGGEGEELKEGGGEGERSRLMMVVALGEDGRGGGGEEGRGGGEGGFLQIWTRRGAAAAATALLVTCALALPVWL